MLLADAVMHRIADDLKFSLERRSCPGSIFDEGREKAMEEGDDSEEIEGKGKGKLYR